MSAPVCPKCGKLLTVRTSKRVVDSQQQYLKCRCGYETSRVVPADAVFRRAKRAISGA